jgi:hypothetical protein
MRFSDSSVSPIILASDYDRLSTENASLREQLAELSRFNDRAFTENHDLRAELAAMMRALPTVDDLAQIIRRVDGNHSLGAADLAEAILATLSPDRKGP